MKYSQDNRRRRKVVDLIYFKREMNPRVTFTPSFWWRLCTIWYQISFLLSHTEKKMHISLHISFHCNFSNKFWVQFLWTYLHFSPFERKRRKCTVQISMENLHYSASSSSTGRCMMGANANDRKKARCAIDLYSLRPANNLIAIGFWQQDSERQRNHIRQV